MPTARAVDRRKAAYLRLAADLVLDGDVASVVDVVTLADVADIVGMSRQSLYRMWGSQTGFQDNLLRYVADRPISLNGFDLVGLPAIGAEPSNDATAWATIVRSANEAEPLVLDQVWLRLDLATLAYERPRDLVALRHRAHGAAIASVAQQVDRFTHHEQRRLRASLSTSDLGALIWSIAIGLNYMSTFPEFVAPRSRLGGSDIGGEEVGVLALCVTALLRGLTVPVPAAMAQRSHEQVGPTRRDTRRPDSSPTEPAWSAEQSFVLDQSAQLLERRIANPIHGVSAPIAQLSLTKLARHAKVSRRTMFNAWATQAAFERDLNDFVHHDQIAESRRLMQQFAERSQGSPQMLMDVCDAMTQWRHTRHDRDAQRSFNYAYLRDQRAASPALRSSVSDYANDLQWLLTRYVVEQNASLVSGLQPSALGIGLTALAVGTKALHLLAPDAQRFRVAWGDGAFSTFAIGYQAIVDFCLPRHGSDNS